MRSETLMHNLVIIADDIIIAQLKFGKTVELKCPHNNRKYVR